MPLIDKYRDMGTVVMGKIESGSVRRGDTLMVMPNKVSVVLGMLLAWMCGKVDGAFQFFWYSRVCCMIPPAKDTAVEMMGGFCMQAHVKVVTVYRDNDEVIYAKPGENLRIRISGVEEEDIIPGFILSSVSKCGISYLALGVTVKPFLFQTRFFEIFAVMVFVPCFGS
jgi:peptide chain release factor subunit 3